MGAWLGTSSITWRGVRHRTRAQMSWRTRESCRASRTGSGSRAAPGHALCACCCAVLSVACDLTLHARLAAVDGPCLPPNAARLHGWRSDVTMASNASRAQGSAAPRGAARAQRVARQGRGVGPSAPAQPSQPCCSAAASAHAQAHGGRRAVSCRARDTGQRAPDMAPGKEWFDDMKAEFGPIRHAPASTAVLDFEKSLVELDRRILEVRLEPRRVRSAQARRVGARAARRRAASCSRPRVVSVSVLCLCDASLLKLPPCAHSRLARRARLPAPCAMHLTVQLGSCGPHHRA